MRRVHGLSAGRFSVTPVLRRAAPDDYDVMQDDEIVGRIYRMKADRELWRWMIRLWDPPPGPSGGLCATLDEATVAFRANCSAIARPDTSI